MSASDALSWLHRYGFVDRALPLIWLVGPFEKHYTLYSGERHGGQTAVQSKAVTKLAECFKANNKNQCATLLQYVDILQFYTFEMSAKLRTPKESIGVRQARSDISSNST